jgi:hypothetical protein
MADGQPNGEYVEEEDEDRQPQRKRVERFGEVADKPKLARGDDLESGDRWRQLVG